MIDSIIPGWSMKIAVFSDTHLQDLRRGSLLLAGLLQRYLPDADMVLHAGDLTHPDLLLAFAPLPVYAVRGNLDLPAADLPDKRVIEVSGKRIGLIHSWGRGAEIEENAKASFAGIDLDVLVYGHSHVPACSSRDGVLYFNPGSCTERRGSERRTIGMLEIGTEIRGRIFDVD